MKHVLTLMAAATVATAAIAFTTALSAPLIFTQELSSTRFKALQSSVLPTRQVFGKLARNIKQKGRHISQLEARTSPGSLDFTSTLGKVEGKLPVNDLVPTPTEVTPPAIDAHHGSPSISSSYPSSAAHPSPSGHPFGPPPSPDFSAILDSGWDADLFNDIPSLLASSHSLSAHSPPAGTPHSVSAHPGAHSSSQAKGGPLSPDYSAIMNGDWDKEDVFSEISSLLNPTAHPSTPPDSHHITGVHAAGASDTSPRDQSAQLGDVRMEGHDGREQESIRHRSAQDDKPPSAPASGKGRRKMEQQQPLTFPTMEELELLPYVNYRAATKRIHKYRIRVRKSNRKDLTEHIDLEEVQRRRKARASERSYGIGTSAADCPKGQTVNNRRVAEQRALKPEERSQLWRVTNLYKKRKRLGGLSDEEEAELHSLQDITSAALKRVRVEIRDKQRAEQRLALHDNHGPAQAEPGAPFSSRG